MKAFVTGGTGLLGNNLVRLLIEQGYEVKLLARSTKKAAQLFVELPVTIIQGDMQNVAAFAGELSGCDVLFHTAAYFREYYQPGDHWKLLEDINVTGTMQLLHAAENYGVSKVIYTSSNGVIGAPSVGLLGDETTPPDKTSMDNLYFRSKVLAEQRIDTFLKTSTLPVVLILPAWMFGPGDTAPTSSGQIVVDYLNRGLPGVIDGGGAPVDVRDVAQTMINAVERGKSGERYIVGGDTFVSFAQLNHLLQSVSGVPQPTLRIPYNVSLIYAWFAETYSRLTRKPTLVTINGVKAVRHARLTSSAKAQRELGATFRPLAETLQDEVAWFRSHRPDLLPRKQRWSLMGSTRAKSAQ